MSDLNPSNKKDPKFLAAAVLVALVLVAGIVLIGVRLLDGGNDNASPPHPTSTDKTPGSTSACGLPDGNQSIPTAGPKTNWELIGRMASPESKRFGPAKEKAGIHSCFAHNPTGALFAAANYLADTENEQVSKDALVDARIFADMNAHLAKSDPDEPGSANSTTQIAAFRIEDFTPDRISVVTVLRATEGPDAGKFAAITFTLGWQAGDWRLVVPPTGKPPTTGIGNISGYTPWAGA